MLLLRLNLLLISASWLFVLPIYVPPDAAWWSALIAFGWALAATALYKSNVTGGYRTRAKSMLYSALLGGALTLSVFLAQAVLMGFYYKMASVYHAAGWLAPAISALMSLFGFSATWEGSIVSVQDYTEVIRFSLTFEKLAALPLLCFLTGEAVTLFIFNAGRIGRRLARTALCVAAYAVARLLVFLALYVSVKQMWLFYDPLIMLASLLPLPLLLDRFNPIALAAPEFSFSRRADWKMAAVTAVLVLAASAGLAVYWGYRDAGEKKPGRVLIDEAHSNWAWATRPFDKEWLGQQSVYNYYLAKDFAGHFFDVRVNADQPISREGLRDYDVLVVKTPTEAFSDEESRAIEEFVRGGGGLFLIGDHTNLFGMSGILNELAQPYRIRFNYDDTFDLATGQPSRYVRPTMLSHPIGSDLNDFSFQTSCTLDAPVASDFVIVGYGLGSERVDYGHKNFFGNIRLDPEDDYGLFLQAAAVKHGKGRVVAFSDSTVFSNFSFFWPGKSELFTRTLDYLNRRNRYGDSINLSALAVSLAGMALMVFAIRKSRWGPLVPAYAVTGALLFLGTAAWIDRVNNGNYPRLAPHTPYTTVAFESEYSNIGLVEMDSLLDTQLTEEERANAAKGAPHRDSQTFRTLYVNLARLGVFSTAKKRFAEALHSGNVVVVVNPNKPFSPSDLHQLDHFLDRGGRLLLMDSITNDNAFANQLLKRFEVQIAQQPGPVKVSLQVPKAAERVAAQRGGPAAGIGAAEQVSYEARSHGEMRFPQLSITGRGNPILADDGLRVVAQEVKRGHGSIVVFVDSAHFSNAFMGAVYKKPDDKERQAYKDLFFLFENYLLHDSHDEASHPITTSADRRPGR